MIQFVKGCFTGKHTFLNLFLIAESYELNVAVNINRIGSPFRFHARGECDSAITWPRQLLNNSWRGFFSMFDSYAGLLEMTHHSIVVQRVDFVHSAALVAHMSAARSFVGNTPSGTAVTEAMVADMPARAGVNMAAVDTPESDTADILAEYIAALYHIQAADVSASDSSAADIVDISLAVDIPAYRVAASLAAGAHSPAGQGAPAAPAA